MFAETTRSGGKQYLWRLGKVIGCLTRVYISKCENEGDNTKSQEERPGWSWLPPNHFAKNHTLRVNVL